MHAEKQYLQILRDLINTGTLQENRTGESAYKIPPRMIQHDMSNGFPILTTKKVAWKTMKVELEGFIKGVTSKSWFQERGCHIWDDWCNPQKVPYNTDEHTKQLMKEEDDLGSCIYGASWRNFKDPLYSHPHSGVDQLQNIINSLHNNPEDRRMLCLAWNPLGLDHTALPACHYSWQVMKRGEYLDLVWTQRSVDTFLGLPFNIASYALLLHLLAKEAGLKEGVLSGSLADLHLYENHLSQAYIQLERKPHELPRIETTQSEDFNTLDWTYGDTTFIGGLKSYQHYPAIKAPVAV